MFDKILFPTDGSDVATSIFEDVLEVASEEEATVFVINVADTNQDSVATLEGEVVDVLEREGEKIVAEMEDRANARGVSVETDVLQGDPYRTIVDYAETVGVDVIVMPTHGRTGLDRFLLGSVTERVVRQSDVPVLTVRPDDDASLEYPYENVLHPTDGSDRAAAARALATEVSRSAGATLHCLHVIDPSGLRTGYGDESAALEEATPIVEEAAAEARMVGLDDVETAVERGTVHEAILAYAEENDVDLLVVGASGRGYLDRYLLGGVTEKLVRSAPIPVLTVREPPEDVSAPEE